MQRLHGVLWCLPEGAELAAFGHPRYQRDRATLGGVTLGGRGAPWAWSSGAAWSYTNWAARMPDGQGPQCLELWTTGEWNDVPCDEGPRAYICQVAWWAGLGLGLGLVLGLGLGLGLG